MREKENMDVQRHVYLILDGTLLDTVESIAHVANQVLTHYGLDSVSVELFNYFAGDGADELIRRCFVKTGGDLSVPG